MYYSSINVGFFTIVVTSMHGKHTDTAVYLSEVRWMWSLRTRKPRVMSLNFGKKIIKSKPSGNLILSVRPITYLGVHTRNKEKLKPGQH